MKNELNSNNGHCSNLIGQRFGRLVILERAEDEIDKKSGKHKTRWLCQCDCGNQKIIRGASLTCGRVRSCGCLLKEASKKLGQKNKGKCYHTNTYDLDSYEYGIGYTNKNEPFYFDKEDYPLIKDISWNISKNGYVVGHYEGKDIRMSRLIMNVLDNPDVVVDHIIPKTKNDNRKKNLRITTQANNARNRRICNNNTSGVTGVYKVNDNKYYACIAIKGKQKRLGFFNNISDAEKARREAELDQYGEYAVIEGYNKR